MDLKFRNTFRELTGSYLRAVVVVGVERVQST